MAYSFGFGPKIGADLKGEADRLEGFERSLSAEELSLLHAVYKEYRNGSFSFRSAENKRIGWDLVSYGLLKYEGPAPYGNGESFRLTRLGVRVVKEFGYRGERVHHPGGSLFGGAESNPFIPKWE